MPKLAYILAASHSGSTLLAMLLGAQAGACSVGELKATSLGDPDSYRCSCQEKICDCPFWHRIAAAMAARGYGNFDITRAGTSIFEVESSYARRLLAPLYRGGILESARDLALSLSPAWHARLAASNARNRALIAALLEVTGAQVVVDSSKVALRLKYLMRIPGLDVQVIHMIRDGRAVSLTYTDEWSFADSSDPQFRGGGSGLRRPPARHTMAEAAREWKRSNEAAETMISTLPKNHWIQVRYEDLCADPPATLKRLADFLGLDPNRARLDFRAVPQHIIGNGMRMDSTSEIQIDDRWKDYLSNEDLQTIEDVAGDLNRRYGYR